MTHCFRSARRNHLNLSAGFNQSLNLLLGNGARSQMARTYLERHVDDFATCGREDLVRHGLLALRESLVQDRELTVENTSVAIVGASAPPSKFEPFRVYDGMEVKQWLDSVADDREGGDDGAAPAAEQMDVDS